ncbi:hypothetical protein ACFOLC_06625 [Lysobacter cavernae]|uniref:ApeI dehydratase-like domain-containing protein n=1 Tax=Lysobacter cavernae TaxID=1685901 RepID=A0ABV7RMU3_9GAMM
MHFVIPADHPCLPGHFPGRPLVPGVVLLERVVEAIEAQHGPLPAMRLPQVKFVQPLLPGQTAQIELETCPEPDRRSAAPRWRFRVLRGATVLATGEVVAAGPEPA